MQLGCVHGDFDGDVDLLDCGSFQRVLGVTHNVLFGNSELEP